MFLHKSSLFLLLPEKKKKKKKAWGNVSRCWLILAVGLGAACSWMQCKTSNEQSRVHLCQEQALQEAMHVSNACGHAPGQGQALHKCEARHAGMHREDAGSLLWWALLVCPKIMDSFWTRTKQKKNRHYIILKSQQLTGQPWGCRQCF